MKTPEQMTAEDYARLGFMAGLEVHQQLETDTKLFCRCPATRYSPRYDAELLRHMRPTMSELGEYDGTALMEFKTRKEIIYRIARDTVCTYEMDDAPPFSLAEQALDIALEIALKLDCKLVSELHIIRKQYLDGSIPTGFQRTTIVGVDGELRVGERIVHVRQLALEEDSCREVSDRGHRRVYMTDRLSIPLIEVVTEPEMRTPAEVVEVGEAVRRLTRSTGKVRTGAGAARQDVNVSVKGGTRIEIKGVPSIKMFRALTHYEALRQKALLDIRRELLGRGLRPDTFAPTWHEVTALVRHTTVAPIRKALKEDGVVYAVRLPRFRGILRHRTSHQHAFDHELSGRVRVIACLDGSPNLMHDEDPGMSIAPRLWDAVRRALDCVNGDSLVLVWGPAEDARLAASEVAERAREALIGVPSETRQARADGATNFERILPGPNRMYPDTDLPPIAITDERVARIEDTMGPLPREWEACCRERGLHLELIIPLERSGHRDLFERVVTELNVPPKLAAVVLGQLTRWARRRYALYCDEERIFELFKAFAADRFTREAFRSLLKSLGSDPGLKVGDVIEAALPRSSAPDPQATVNRALAEETHWRAIVAPEARLKAAMGVAMDAGLRGRVPGREVRVLVDEALSAADIEREVNHD